MNVYITLPLPVITIEITGSSAVADKLHEFDQRFQVVGQFEVKL